MARIVPQKYSRVSITHPRNTTRQQQNPEILPARNPHISTLATRKNANRNPPDSKRARLLPNSHNYQRLLHPLRKKPPARRRQGGKLDDVHNHCDCGSRSCGGRSVQFAQRLAGRSLVDDFISARVSPPWAVPVSGSGPLRFVRLNPEPAFRNLITENLRLQGVSYPSVCLCCIATPRPRDGPQPPGSTTRTT